MAEHSHTVNAVLEDVGPCKKLLKVEVPKDEVAREVDQQIESVRRSISVPGFRKGKVPRKFVEKNYRQAIEEDVRKHLLEHSYVEALKGKGLEPATLLGEGKVDKLKFSTEEGLTYEVTFQIRPKFELPAYKGVAVEVSKARVTDDMVDKELSEFRKGRGELRPVEDKNANVEAEDTLNADVEVWLADEYETFSEQQGEKKDPDAASVKPLKTMSDVEIKLQEDNVAGLEVEDLADGLLGLKLGEWGEAETHLPVDYEVKEGQNEAAVLRIKINGIKRLYLPELTDEWAKSAGYDSVDAMKREARESLFRAREMRREDEIETKVLDKLLSTTGNFDLPLDLVEAEVKDAARRREVELRLQENKPEEEAKRLAEAEAHEKRAEIEHSLRLFFLIDEIARREKLRVNDADVDARISRISAASGKPPAEVKRFLEEREVLPQLRHEILNEKARAYLRENANVTEGED